MEIFSPFSNSTLVGLKVQSLSFFPKKKNCLDIKIRRFVNEIKKNKIVIEGEIFLLRRIDEKKN